VFVDVVPVYKVKVTVVEIVHVPLVFDRRMRTAVGVFVRMVVVRRVFHACSIHPPSRPGQPAIYFAIRYLTVRFVDTARTLLPGARGSLRVLDVRPGEVGAKIPTKAGVADEDSYGESRLSLALAASPRVTRLSRAVPPRFRVKGGSQVRGRCNENRRSA